MWVLCCPCRPLRGHARSHRFTTGFRTCAVPVGAGVPANGPQSGPVSASVQARQVVATGAESRRPAPDRQPRPCLAG
ncbi:hypothetical protein DZA28_27260 [Pseudomonas alloputida]|uniref:Uncharacterized protein n=1 Tax=Pseudomonas alloputida TaxID=1940621 RepID=A0ABY3DCX7_9PSED|nr:hypothetical protein DZA28_27260 [Pseudomonas alloputida]